MRQLIAYGIAGVLATAIDIFAYWAATRLIGLPVVPSTVIAWTCSVIFAYWANRVYVFQSKADDVMRECAEFFGARIATGLLDVIIMAVFTRIFYDVWVKIASNIIVIILNYVLSKAIIFKKGEKS